MQVRRRAPRVAGVADMADDVAGQYRHSLADAIGPVVEGDDPLVVVAAGFGGVVDDQRLVQAAVDLDSGVGVEEVGAGVGGGDAREAGADGTDVASTVMELTDGGAHVAVDAVGIEHAVADARIPGALKAVADAGHTPVLISPESGEVDLFDHLEKSGTQKVDVELSDADINDYAALVLPGGVAPAAAVAMIGLKFRAVRR